MSETIMALTAAGYAVEFRDWPHDRSVQIRVHGRGRGHVSYRDQAAGLGDSLSDALEKAARRLEGRQCEDT